MNSHLKIMVFLIIFAGSIRAGDDAGTGSPFSLGAGSRELAMSGASLVESDAATSPFWNPSRLTTIERLSLTGLHSRLFFSGNVYQYLGIAIPTLNQGGFGLGVFRQGVDDIEKRDDANMLTGETRDIQMRIYLAHGRSWSGYNLGIATTLEYHSLDNLSAVSSPGINVSAAKRFDVDRWWLREVSTATTVANLLRPGIRLADAKYEQPREYKIGIGFELRPNSTNDHRVLISSSLSKSQFETTKLAIGIEYTLIEALSIRGGAKDGRTSFGLGLRHSGIGFDYAILERDFASLHVVSLTTYFGRTKSERLTERAAKREVEFTNSMNDMFRKRNTDLIEDLLNSGTRSFNEARYAEAISDLDRALFLSRHVGYDTSAIVDLSSQATKRIERSKRNEQFEMYLDSARVCADRQDFIAAQYYSGQALDIDEASDVAHGIYRYSNQVLSETEAIDVMVQDKLDDIDSALSIEDYDRASFIVESLEEVAPDNESVLLRTMMIDNALLLLQIKNSQIYAATTSEQINENMRFDSNSVGVSAQSDSTMVGIGKLPDSMTKVSAEDIAPHLRVAITEVYSEARMHFQNGDLDTAMILWEKVEQLAPGYESVRGFLVKAYTFSGANHYAKKQRMDALNVWKKAMRIDPHNKEIQGYITRTKSEINQLKGSFNE